MSISLAGVLYRAYFNRGLWGVAAILAGSVLIAIGSGPFDDGTYTGQILGFLGICATITFVGLPVSLFIVVFVLLRRRALRAITALSAVLMVYALSVVTFALIYMVCGIIDFENPDFSKTMDIVDCVYFSVVTMATVGYGDISPISHLGKVMVCIEIIVGVLFNVVLFALLGNAINQGADIS